MKLGLGVLYKEGPAFCHAAFGVRVREAAGLETDWEAITAATRALHAVAKVPTAPANPHIRRMRIFQKLILCRVDWASNSQLSSHECLRGASVMVFFHRKYHLRPNTALSGELKEICVEPWFSSRNRDSVW